MKKLIPILICVLICTMLFGCSAKSDENESTVGGTTETANQTVSTSTKSGSRIEELTDAEGRLVMNVVDEDGNTVTEKMVLVTAENGEPVCNDKGQFLVESDYGEQFFVDEPTATTQQTSQTTKKKETTSKKADGTTSKTTAKNTTATTAKAKTTTAKATTKATTKAKHNITLNITVKTADKTIIDNYSLSVDSNYSVLKALRQACEDKKIELTEEETALHNPSISAIDGISGDWVYSLNGGEESHKVTQQKLKSGDTIVFTLK